MAGQPRHASGSPTTTSSIYIDHRSSACRGSGSAPGRRPRKGSRHDRTVQGPGSGGPSQGLLPPRACHLQAGRERKQSSTNPGRAIAPPERAPPERAHGGSRLHPAVEIATSVAPSAVSSAWIPWWIRRLRFPHRLFLCVRLMILGYATRPPSSIMRPTPMRGAPCLVRGFEGAVKCQRRGLGDTKLVRHHDLPSG
jgi:hypothetical protein